jgi:putative transposase
MTRIFQSILYVIATATHKELARQVRYLKVENQILRSKLPGRFTIEPRERQRLLKFGEKLGKAIHQLVTIVAPSTFLRWIREAKRNRKKGPSRKRGRPMTSAEIRRLIIKLARENSWGYGRIAGELAKLGIVVSESTITNMLLASGVPTSPKREGGTWDDFLKRHASSLWEMDLFSQKVVTLRGIREVFVIAFLHVHTRRAPCLSCYRTSERSLGHIPSRIARDPGPQKWAGRPLHYP